MIWLKGIVLFVALVGVTFAGLALYGKRSWDTQTDILFAQLERGRKAPVIRRYDAREIEALPAVVQRYFRAALTDGAPIVVAASVDHRGTFNMSTEQEKWLPFRSTQRVVTQPPGFVWDGRVTMFPWVNVHVHDAYVQGEGVLHPAILGVFSLANLRGQGDVARGELMRYFAEAAWYPTALLPSQGVAWTAVDERSADATLVEGGMRLTLRFTFSNDALIESVRAEDRGRTVGDKIVATPWEGQWSNYETRDGMRVPLTGEVAWLTPEGRKPYWRGTITSLRYEFAR
jgi:hypothetical protein